jgi:hypothetical protein
MSINNPFNSDSQGIYSDYSVTGSFFSEPNKEQQDLAREIAISTVPATLGGYIIPIESVKNQAFEVDLIIEELIGTIENLLSQIYVDAYSNFDLGEAHRRICEEARKENSSIEENINFICFGEIIYAERLASHASNIFIDKYMKVLTQSTFSYLFYFRILLKIFKNEISNIKNTLIFDYGDEYEDESQEKVALQFDSWSKTTLHCIQRISSIISSESEKINSTELDNLSEKHAIQSQAFFAIKLNSINNRIDNLLAHLGKDFKSNGDVFFSKYLKPSIRMQREISSALTVDFQTTSFLNDYPELSLELFEASNVIKGNFYSIYSDLYERYTIAKSEVDRVFELINQSRKYSGYISQLSHKGVNKKKILADVYDEKYNILFKSIVVNPESKTSLRSSHSLLDDLDLDHHPQYLLRDGGNITGSISVEPGVKIDGVDISEHSHTGSDGSSKIRSTDIDYSSVRQRSEDSIVYASKPISLVIDSFDTKIVDGGQPVTDVTFTIEINDFDENNYEFEMSYTEIEQFIENEQ